MSAAMGLIAPVLAGGLASAFKERPLERGGGPSGHTAASVAGLLVAPKTGVARTVALLLAGLVVWESWTYHTPGEIAAGAAIGAGVAAVLA